MALLQQIIEDASGTGSVPGVLRRLKVVAKRIGAENTLLPWVIRELEGYSAEDTVPTYRSPVRLQPYGIFTTGVRLPLRRDALPENWRTPAQFEFPRTHPLAVIEGLAVDGGASIAWSGEVVAVLNGRIERGEAGLNPILNCIGVTALLNRHAFDTVLDAVRNRALDLALELESVAPDVGEVGVPEEVNEEARSVTTNIFLGASFAGSNNAFGSTDVSQAIAALTDSAAPADPPSTIRRSLR
ncbi:hypothetical protein ACIGO9_29995 [Nocardia asteroides]|uniref:AbiTii domain-containing protein n=1 Tax=Nocardia asteroides TaxID=1824 RepID=UPI0037C6C539